MFKKYDVIAIIGDMQNRQEEGKKNGYLPFIQLLEGIVNKSEVYYIPGNHGPYPFVGEEGFNFSRALSRRAMENSTLRCIIYS